MSTTTTLKIEGMTCGNCARHVKEALLSVPGVENAVADHAAGVAEVESTAALDRTAIATALEDAGYALK